MMGLVEAKLKILEKLWENQEPMRAREVAQKMNLGAAATTMHLVGLKKSGYVYTPKQGNYAITDLGKEVIGLPKIHKVDAAIILSTMPNNKAFHFYTGIHEYTRVLARSLADFCDKIQKVEEESVEFHVPRKDFEHWVQSLGDIELAKRLSLICDMHLHGKELKANVYEIAKRRLEELEHILG